MVAVEIGCGVLGMTSGCGDGKRRTEGANGWAREFDL
jgi:hypothetical protein